MACRLVFFSLFQNGLSAPKVDLGGCEVLQALVVALVVVVIDEGFDLSIEIAWQEVVFQQDAVLQGLVPSFDLALCLRMIRRTSAVLHSLALQPFSQIA